MICGVWVFSASASSAGPVDQWLREISESDRWAEIAAPVVDAYQSLLADSATARGFQQFATSRDGMLALAGVALGFVVVLGFASRRLRGTGELTLRLDFPAEIEGEFDVQLFRRSQRRGRASNQRASTSMTRSSVHRETQFDRIPAGVWFLAIDGTIRPPQSQAILATISEEIEVTIAANQCASINHPLPAVETPMPK